MKAATAGRCAVASATRGGFAVWWEYVIIAAVLVFGVYAFLTFVGFEKRTLSRRTTRTAESMYRSYADSLRKQRQALQHGEEQANDGGGQPREPGDTERR
jgi:hypothetical protein